MAEISSDVNGNRRTSKVFAQPLVILSTAPAEFAHERTESNTSGQSVTLERLPTPFEYKFVQSKIVTITPPTQNIQASSAIALDTPDVTRLSAFGGGMDSFPSPTESLDASRRNTFGNLDLILLQTLHDRVEKTEKAVENMCTHMAEMASAIASLSETQATLIATLKTNDSNSCHADEKMSKISDHLTIIASNVNKLLSTRSQLETVSPPTSPLQEPKVLKAQITPTISSHTTSVVSMPMPVHSIVSTSIPAASVPIPVSGPVPISLPAPISVSSPMSVPIPISVPSPTSVAIPIPVSTPASIPTPSSASMATHLSRSVPTPLPSSMPTPLSSSVPTPLSSSIPVVIPVPINVPSTYDTDSIKRKHQNLLEMQKMQSGRPTQLPITPVTSVDDLKLKPDIIKSLKYLGLEQLNSMQQRAVPLILAGEDIIAQCPRGPIRLTTYCIPIAEIVDPMIPEVQVMVISDSLHIMKQIHEFFLSMDTKANIMCLDEKKNWTNDIERIVDSSDQDSPHIIITTPQNALDLVHSSETAMAFERLKLVVLEDLEGVNAVPNLKSQLPNMLTLLMPGAIERQIISFGSQLSESILNFAASLRKKDRPAHVLVKKKAFTPHVKHYYIYIAIEKEKWKLDALIDMLEDVPRFSKCIIWCKDDESVERVAYRCVVGSWDVLSIQSEMGPIQRRQTISQFHSTGIKMNNKSRGRILIICDQCISSTQDQLYQIPLAIGYDLPTSAKDYERRIATIMSNHHGRGGIIVNIATSRSGDMEKLQAIENHTGIKMRKLPSDLGEVL